MSFLKRVRDLALCRRNGSSNDSSIAGSWHVTDISAPHPFGQYSIDLRENGTLEWAALVWTKDVGELEVTGSGTWRTEGETLHYTSGDSEGSVRYSLDAEVLTLDGLPATKVGPGVRCVLNRVPPAS
jgi:hypothetical protein